MALERFGGWARHMSCGLLVVSAVGACGNKSSNDRAGEGGTPAVDEELEGFERYAELGARCRAAVAHSPADVYGPLAFIPCTSGEAGCDEVAWDGEVGWDPVGTGDMLEFSLQFSYSSAGELRHVLITHQYPNRVTDGMPFEAVAYDAATGAPVAAWRNLVQVYDFEDNIGGGSDQDCLLSIGLAAEQAVVLAKAAESSQMHVLTAPLAQAASATAFSVVDADRSVLRRPLVASGGTAAFDQDDGRLFRVDAAAGAVEASYGPGVRLWLLGVAGDDVFARTASPQTDGFYWFEGSDAFTRVDLPSDQALADATRLVWVQTDEAGNFEIYVAPRSAADPSGVAQRIATIPNLEVSSLRAQSVSDLSLGGGVLALHTSVPFASESDLHLVDLQTGTTHSRHLGLGESDVRLLANTRTHVWMGRSQFLFEDDTQFESIVRFEITGE